MLMNYSIDQEGTLVKVCMKLHLYHLRIPEGVTDTSGPPRYPHFTKMT
jgi:hypothetical protein